MIGAVLKTSLALTLPLVATMPTWRRFGQAGLIFAFSETVLEMLIMAVIDRWDTLCVYIPLPILLHVSATVIFDTVLIPDVGPFLFREAARHLPHHGNSSGV
jgi:hypothetical protein